MVKDKKLELCAAQGAITASAATQQVVNFGEAMNGEINSKGRAFFVVTVAGGGTGTVQFVLQDCDTEGGTYVDIAASKVYDADVELVAGKLIEVPLPGIHRQFVRGYFTVVGVSTGLTVTGHIVCN